MKNKITDKQIAKIISKTQNWVESIIIGLDLCPFAKEPFQKGQIRFTVAVADTMKEYIETFIDELKLLDEKPDIETTLLLVPDLVKVDYFQPFVRFCEETILINDWGKIYQVVPFHPHQRIYREAPNSSKNMIAMSPYPTVHILREASVEAKGRLLKEDIRPRNDAILEKITMKELIELLEK